MNGASGYPIVVERMWAAHQARRALGFAADDIFVIPDGGHGFDEVIVSLHVQGKEFNWIVGRRGSLDKMELRDVWVRWAEAYNASSPTLPENVLREIYERFVEETGALDIVAAIMNKGITLPLQPDASALDVDTQRLTQWHRDTSVN